LNGPALRWDRVDPNLVAIMRELVNGVAPWPLLLYGSPGTGKTAAGKLLNAVVYKSVMALASDYEAVAFDLESQTWSDIKKSELVVVDEIGARTRQANEYSFQAMKTILDWREDYKNRTGVYISNLEPTALSKVYDDRIVSRLMAGTVYEIKGVDMRIKGNRVTN